MIGNYSITRIIVTAAIWQTLGLVYYFNRQLNVSFSNIIIKDDLIMSAPPNALPPKLYSQNSKTSRLQGQPSVSKKDEYIDYKLVTTKNDVEKNIDTKISAMKNELKDKMITEMENMIENKTSDLKQSSVNIVRKSLRERVMTTTANTTSTKESPSSSSFSEPLPLSVENSCFAYNSDKWLNRKIESNNDDGFTPELVETLLEGPSHFQKLPSLFDQTICHEDSPLRSFPQTKEQRQQQQQNQQGRGIINEDGIDLASVEDWYQRFLYLALHWKFHRHALPEYQARKTCEEKDAKDGTNNLQSFMKEHKIGLMDYECRDAKFVVASVGSIGFGAYLNTQASLTILLALRTNRIPILSSQTLFPWQKQKARGDPWLLAPTNCSRKDMQCYFLPLSPCTVTEEDLLNAPIYGVDRAEQRYLIKNVTVPPELENERIVVLNSGLAGKTMDTSDMRNIAFDTINELLEEWKKHHGQESHEADWKALTLAHQWISEKGGIDPHGLLRQVYVYMLRPNPHYKALLREQMSLILPPDINPSETIGIAIRGSDKCISESMCLPFDRYMDLVTDIAHPTLSLLDSSSDPTSTMTTTIQNHLLEQKSSSFQRPKLIMTTEDPSIFNASLAYQRNESFPFQFLVNNNDNMQGSGYPSHFSSSEGEKTIVSSLTALQFHFNAGRVYLNCCSNFHLVLKHLLHAQCGARRHGHDFVFNDKNNISEAMVSYKNTFVLPASSSLTFTASNTTTSTSTSTISHDYQEHDYDHHHRRRLSPPITQCLSEDSVPRRYRICCAWTSKKDGECKKLWQEYSERKEVSYSSF
jgi:hypothetical protein